MRPATPEHPSLEKLRSYCAGELGEFEESRIEEHFGHCAECVAAVRRMDQLLFEGFGAESHVEALRAEAAVADPLLQALRAAVARYGAFETPLRDWLRSARALWGAAIPRSLGEPGLALASGGVAEDVVRVRLLAGESRAQVTVREDERTLVIETTGVDPAICVLFPVDRPQEVRLAAFVPAGEVRAARFEGVPEGEYLLAVGPG